MNCSGSARTSRAKHCGLSALKHPTLPANPHASNSLLFLERDRADVCISPGGGQGGRGRLLIEPTGLLNFVPLVLSNNREIIGKVCSSVILDPFQITEPSVGWMMDGRIDRSARSQYEL